MLTLVCVFISQKDIASEFSQYYRIEENISYQTL